MATASMETGEAYFSEDRFYRYMLERHWDARLPTGVFIGLNPSTADESRLDPTLRRVWRFMEREGCGGMCILNLFAFRATDPRAMKAYKDPIGPANDEWIERVVGITEGPILCGWGANGGFLNRSTDVKGSLPKSRTCCLGLTKDGEPRHPLYITSAAQFESWPQEELING